MVPELHLPEPSSRRERGQRLQQEEPEHASTRSGRRSVRLGGGEGG